jgi:hypothetical protein
VRVAVDGDDTAWSGILHHVVSVVRCGHDFSECMAAEDAMVWAAEVDHLEGDPLCAVIRRSPECYRQCDLADWEGLPPWDDAMEAESS